MGGGATDEALRIANVPVQQCLDTRHESALTELAKM